MVATAVSPHATTAAVGKPRPTSSAYVGPESAATRPRASPNSWLTTSECRFSDGNSSPLAACNTGISGPTWGATSRATSRMAREIGTSNTARAPDTTSSIAVLGWTDGGTGTPGRYTW